MLLPATEANAARSIARRALQAVDALALQRAAPPAEGRITLCAGGGCRDFTSAVIRRHGVSDNAPEALIVTAERALKSAKSAGSYCARIFDVLETEALPTSLA